ncbi:UDP-N-acetylmuramoylalanyl-D-glutamate--2,6-diaminopimelate ligase [Hypnocyclicus thermotrophus]|uniref:UDP-N-acetylmuramoyl-L-alanyl-D-glutamate--2,6-diaminopimelate ligase n=1 Tax=Hypnocyclicus thermotrophus TaxID=1627895 RepID=A0AA46DY59_9FUSO|nr:UDP-N-acetylmuramoyl-L-alanyl-D-glutamate--2,6-diaminopimelate ligase [Hypnocyclicus thermotrophus]TDT69715.1 UDP-N-acetylmuramoylalanyl-D-glutamate--2,6-diaminopimelate ligase [Hypnocyclicus thermotrophus]
MIKFIDFLNDLDYEILNQGEEFPLNNMQYDSRKIKENDIFIALEGYTVDGHNYINKSIENGAKLILCSKKLKKYNKNITYILIKNLRKNLGFIASRYYNFPEKKLKIIGITGTNGKTTITYILENILKNIARIGTIEYKIGDEILEAPNTTPESLDIIKICKKAVEKNIKYLVMEVSSHALELNRVNMLNFEVAGFSNLTQDHLDYHKTMENYFNAKRKLFLQTTKNNFVFNIDDKYGKRLYNEFGGISYGKNGDISGKILEYKLSSMLLKLNILNKEYIIETKLLGKFNLYNILCAIGISLKLNIPIDLIIDSIKKMNVVPGRCESIDIGQNFSIILDYAHTPDGLINILDTLHDMKKNRIITLFGAGGDRDKTKRPLMAKAATKYSDYIIITSDNPRTEEPDLIIDDIETGLKEINFKNYTKITDRRDAIKYAIDIAKENDIILLAGKGHETYQIIGRKKINFNEKNIVIKYLNDLKK